MRNSARPNSRFAVRLLFGALSGLIMMAVVNLDLALGILKGSPEGVFLAGIVAGFVERFVPSLLIRLTHDSESAAEKPPEAPSSRTS